MAFKMKGFPYVSGFKHTGGTHEDHHKGEQGNQESEETSELIDGKYTMDQMAEILEQYKNEYGQDEGNKPGKGTIRFRNKWPKVWQKLAFGE